MKKTISLILAVIMLLSAVPMQSFALFDWLKPKVVKVEMLDNYPISNQYVQTHAGFLDDGVCYIYGDEVFNEYKYKVYFSNGRSVEVSYEGITNLFLFSGVEDAYAYIIADLEKCAKAIAEGKNTVEVEILVTVWYSGNGGFDSFSFTMEKPIVDRVIENVSLVDPMPESYDIDWPADDFVGKKFEVEYADGSKEVHTLVASDYRYYLGDYFVELWHGEDKYVDEETDEIVYYKGLDINYRDCITSIERELLPCQYESIEVTDYKINGKGSVTELTYKLTYKDGRVIEKTCIPEKAINYTEYVVIDNIDGNKVYVGVDSFGDSYYIETWIGYDVWEVYYYNEYENIADFCDCRCHKDGFLNYILNAILCRIWLVFGIREYCNCGVWHW